MRGRFRLLPLWVAVSCWAPAWGDGPHVAFHGTEGAYTVTLFSAPDPLVAGPAEFSLLVQNASDGALAAAGGAKGRLALSGSPAIAFAFAPGGGGNAQMAGATVQLPQSGSYALQLDLSEPPGVVVHFAGVLPVEPNHGKRNTVLWAVFVPPMIVFLFLANQYGKQRLVEARARAQGKRG